MIFIILPDIDEVLDMRLIFSKIKPLLVSDFRDIHKIRYNRLILNENVEESTFRVDRYALRLDKEKNVFIPMNNRPYYVKGEDLVGLLKQILTELDFNDSVCFINNDTYRKIFNILDSRLEFVQLETYDKHSIYYLKANLKDTKKEKNYGINSLLKY